MKNTPNRPDRQPHPALGDWDDYGLWLEELEARRAQIDAEAADLRAWEARQHQQDDASSYKPGHDSDIPF